MQNIKNLNFLSLCTHTHKYVTVNRKFKTLSVNKSTRFLTQNGLNEMQIW